jgi:LuxR family maltose regulon positive regulatory protein
MSQARLCQPVPITRGRALKARIHLKQGRLDKADWARDFDPRRSLSREFDLLTLVRVAYEGSLTGYDLLERLRILAEAQNRMGSVLEILLTEALAHQALATLERALTLAQAEGYLRTFVDEGAMRLIWISLTIATRPSLVWVCGQTPTAFGSPSFPITTPQSQLPEP